MSELSTNEPTTNENAPGYSEAAFEAFDASLAELSEQVPELSTIEGLREEASKVIAEFGIRPTLFRTPERTLVFSGIMAKYIYAHAEQTGDPSPKSRELMADMLTVLAHDHSDILDEAFAHDDVHSHDLGEKNNVLAYDAYTDKGLTAELESAIQNRGILDGVKQRLGIDESNEDPYEIRVLSVAYTDIPYHGLEADRSTLDDAFSMDVLDAVTEERTQITEWKNGLLRRGTELAKRLGRTELTADAWVTVLDGTTTLCLSSPFAEKLIDPTATDNASYYSDSDRARDTAVIEHEYAHTQGGASVDRDIIGINMEELRAETFSGNRLGYNDTKSFFSDYAMFTGHNIREQLRTKPKGGANVELYTSIANNVGVDSMTDVLFALPHAYAESDQASAFLRNIAKTTGGYDGVLTSLLKKRMEQGDTKFEERLAKSAEAIAKVVLKPGSTLDLDGFVTVRKRQGVSVGAELIRDYIVAHYPKAG